MDSCWVALQNLEEITKKFQRCTLEKLSMDQLFWECESNMITRRVHFPKINMLPDLSKKKLTFVKSVKNFIRSVEKKQEDYSRLRYKKLN